MDSPQEQSLRAINAELEKQLAAKNRDLEIEAALERVRTAAMAMAKPDNLLNICKLTYAELQTLGFKAIRNSQIFIFDDPRGAFINYGFSDDEGANIAEIFYDSHPRVKEFITTVRRTSDAFAELSISGDELIAWRQYRIDNGEPDDSRLGDIDTLYYYFYSIGVGAIGVSNFEALSEGQRQILKRFRNVFDLAYRRYADIQLAAAQAKEARLETALERVRTVAMGMRKPDDLLDICQVLFEEFKALDFADLRNAMINILHDDKGFFLDYDFNDNGASVTPFLYNSHPIMERQVELTRSASDAFIEHALTGHELEDFKAFRERNGEPPDPKLENISGLYYYFYSIGIGSLGISTFSALKDDKLEVLKRFRNVFDLAYRRYADIQLAEAQSREAQIELALERVRARTMAMQHSDELSETAYILFQQFKELGENPDQATIGIINEAENVIEYWVTMYGSQINKVFKFPIDEPNVTNKIYQAWKAKKTSLVIDLSGKELHAFTKFRESLGGAKFNPEEKRRVINVAFFSKGLINVQSSEERSAESIRLLERFAGVFDSTYTRFLDLKKAEAQAREAQIELSLERVRASAMAMHKTDQLLGAAELLYRELTGLGIKSMAITYVIMAGDEKSAAYYSINPVDGKLNPVPFDLSHTETEVMRFILSGWKKQEAVSKLVLDGEATLKHQTYIAGIVQAHFVKNNFDQPFSVEAFLEVSPKEAVIYTFNFAQGYIFIIGSEHLTKSQEEMVMRFTKVFEMTYRRFLDLQKAEEQARESQIQLALERVRARTMAMQKSEELHEVIQLVFDQLQQLNFNIDNANFALNYKETNDLDLWLAAAGAQYATKICIPYFSHPIFDRFNKVKEKGGFFADTLSFDEKNSFFEHFFKYTPEITNERKAFIFEKPGFARSAAFMKNTALTIINYQGVPYSEAENNTLLRFGQVFDQTYTRFSDLKQAEEQAKEAQIQLALERVRARTMAMQKSDELAETVSLLFKQLLGLGIPTEQIRTCGIVTFNAKEPVGEQWITEMNGDIIPRSFMVPYDEAPAYKTIYKWWKQGKEFEVNHLEGNALQEHLGYLAKYTKVPLSVLSEQSSEIYNHVLFFSQGCLFIITRSAMTEYHDVFRRFGAVFQQSYTRFLDLKKAEAQAKEAQIEAALERVRSRTMGMQKSDELKEIIKVVYEQLVNLNILAEHAGFIMDYRDSENMNIWLADKHFDPSWVSIPYFDSPHWNSFIEAKAKGSDFFANLLTFEEKNKFYHDLFALVPGVTDEAREYYLNCPGLAASTVLLDNVGLYIENFSGIPYTDEENATLMRFGKVFQQTYTRFLDLKKAEAQAREAQIELSLERVRAKTMAMHNSGHVGETVAAMFDELVKLGIEKTVRCGILIIDETKHMEVWTASYDAGGKVNMQIGRIDMMVHPLISNIHAAWKNKEQVRTYELAGKDLRAYYKAINDSPEYPVKFDLASLPVEQTNNAFFFPEGAIFAFTLTPLPEHAVKLFKRFAGVFGQTYRRYLDLQRAEAAAHEARIEASLERVRGKAMAMRNSNDLSAATSLVFSELQHLGINPIRSGVGLVTKETRKARIYSNTITELTLMGEVALSGHPIFEQQYRSWLNHENYYVALGGKELASYYKILSAALNADLGVTGKNNREEYGYWFMFSEGFLYAWSDEPYTEAETRILERFKNVIELTFRRYIELQKSEASARDAVREASLDRVRAEIASMRSTEDLDRITPLIWNELTILGIPFIRCGVFIMDEEAELIHTHLSTADGKGLATFDLKFDSQGIGQNVIPAWREKQVATIHWTKEEFAEYTQNLVSQGTVTSGERYVTEHPDTSLDLHFLPFLQGMLYVGNTAPLTEDETDLVRSLADAFSTAYARYEDFNKLEAAKKQVENTLTDLKAAQTKLIQSEKMASLGELTAGIAHEIQNPLNFVNNFSEVNQEMLEELEEELRAGNIEDALAITADLKGNEQKISHHGKRADAIVKGMLQHSRTGGGEKQPTIINALADEFMRLSYHGLRAKDKVFNAELVTHFDADLPKISVIGQDMGRVLLNLFNNAFYAVNQKKKTIHGDYKPEVTVTTSTENGQVIIKVKDNGVGMPEHIKEKIMQPFFTTKPTGEGTGLGLSLTYDMVVKGHGGTIQVNSVDGEGSEFIIALPIIKIT